MINEFKQAMMDAGITTPPDINADGQLHRFKIDGKNTGWYVLFGGDYWAGSFGDWRTDLKVKWKQSGKATFTRVDREEMDKRRIELEQLELEKQAKAAEKSREVIRLSKIAPVTHPYLVKKCITYARVNAFNRRLVIPIVEYGTTLPVGVQYIDAYGKKMFEKGQKKKGCFNYIYGKREKIIICEGWSTGVSLNNEFKCIVLVALDCGNLTPVAINARKANPHTEILIAADNDESGVGERKAIEAAQAIGCEYIIPPEIGDFNDYFNRVEM